MWANPYVLANGAASGLAVCAGHVVVMLVLVFVCGKIFSRQKATAKLCKPSFSNNIFIASAPCKKRIKKPIFTRKAPYIH